VRPDHRPRPALHARAAARAHQHMRARAGGEDDPRDASERGGGEGHTTRTRRPKQQVAVRWVRIRGSIITTVKRATSNRKERGTSTAYGRTRAPHRTVRWACQLTEGPGNGRPRCGHRPCAQQPTADPSMIWMGSKGNRTGRTRRLLVPGPTARRRPTSPSPLVTRHGCLFPLSGIEEKEG
jgi:hypothetical protein